MKKIYKFIRSTLNPLNRRSLFASIISPGKCGSGSDDDKKNKPGKKSGEEDPCRTCVCCQCPSDNNPFTPTMYDCRKYGHCLPSNSVTPCFDILPNVPTGIFRCTAGEVLGRGAAKCYCYQCPEYFSYQHMTYYDMHLILRAYRNPSPKSGRTP